MSGGENQRVAIARALVTKPAIVLADEPSGNLDESTSDSVMNLLFDLVAKHKSTLLLVTHNLELAKRCDRSLMLRGGKFE
jgi:predicted ABC-type transport system involved in lysophospholipase L1 biosynthesis ATPase subunit